MADDVVQVEWPADKFRRRWVTSDRHVTEPLMGSTCMIVAEPASKDMPQVVFAEDNEMVQDLVLGPLHPSFGKRIQIRRTRRNGSELNLIGFGN